MRAECGVLVRACFGGLVATLIGSAAWAQVPLAAPASAAPGAEQRRVTRAPPLPKVALLECASQGSEAREFCAAHNVAIVECADKRAAADIRECIQSRVPAAAPPACPPNGMPGVSSADRAACEQHRVRYSGCGGRVGEAHRACMSAQLPPVAERSARSVPPPVGAVLPVEAQKGAAQKGAGRRPGVSAQPVMLPIVPLPPPEAMRLEAPLVPESTRQ